MKKPILFTAILFSFLLLNCSSVKDTGSQNRLEDNTWILRSISGADVKLEKAKEITLRFENATGSISGFGGCNHYFGKYTLLKDSISFTGIGSTETACNDLNTETEYYRNLQKTGRFTIVSGTLSLLSSGIEILRFEKK